MGSRLSKLVIRVRSPSYVPVTRSQGFRFSDSPRIDVVTSGKFARRGRRQPPIHRGPRRDDVAPRSSWCTSGGFLAEGNITGVGDEPRVKSLQTRVEPASCVEVACATVLIGELGVELEHIAEFISCGESK